MAAKKGKANTSRRHGTIGRRNGQFVIYDAEKREHATFATLDEALAYFHFVQAFNSEADALEQADK